MALTQEDLGGKTGNGCTPALGLVPSGDTQVYVYNGAKELIAKGSATGPLARDFQRPNGGGPVCAVPYSVENVPAGDIYMITDKEGDPGGPITAAEMDSYNWDIWLYTHWDK